MAYDGNIGEGTDGDEVDSKSNSESVEGAEPSPSTENSENGGEIGFNEESKELAPDQSDPNESNTEVNSEQLDNEVSSEQFDPNESESSEEKEAFDPNSPDEEVEPEQFDPNEEVEEEGEKYPPDFDPNELEGNVEQDEFDPNESNETEEPDQFNPTEGSETSNESDQYEMRGDDGSNYDPYEYGNNFNAESMNTVLLSENLIYSYFSEYMALMAEKEAETMVQGEQTDVDNSKGEISELEQFLNEERERIRLEQQQAGLDEITEPEPELVAKEEDVEQEVEVGNQSEEMVPHNEKEVENQEMKLEEELQSAIPNESIESDKVEEMEEKNEEPQPHGIEEKIEEQEKNLKADDEKNEKYEEHQSKNQIEEKYDTETEPIAHEDEMHLIKEELEEKEEREEVTKEGELNQINQELEVIHEINSNETEVLTTGQEEDLEQDYFSPYREKQSEIEEYKDPQQELEEILEQTREIEENYEKAKKLYNQETGKRPIYANNETEGFKQWLEQKKESEEKQEHLQIQEDNSEMVKKEIEQESDERINPKLQPLLKEIIENFEFLENLTAKFKELYGSAQINQISKTEKKELKLLINSLKKIGPNKLMFFTSIQAIKRYAIKEKFSDKANLNQALNHFFTKFLQKNLVFKNLKELISPIESELFEKFMQYTHETELIKNLVNEFNKSGSWIRNLRPTQTFINFINKKRKLLENNSQNSSSNAIKKQVEIISTYISLIKKIKENDTLTKAIRNLILTNKQKFNAYNIEQWLLISDTSARNQLKKLFTEEEYQEYVRTQKHVSLGTIEEIVKKKGGNATLKK